MKRSVAIAAFFQETNCFAPTPTGLPALERGGLIPVKAVEARFAGTNTELGGFIGALAQGGAVPLFLPSLWLMPAGPLTKEALDRFAAVLDDALDRLPVRPDGLLLSLHGALVAEGEPDASGWLVELLRRHMDGVPLVATLDSHANLTARMVRNADLVVGYRTYPHTDLAETGRRAAAVLWRLCGTRLKPMSLVLRLPLIVPTETSQHDASPMRETWRLLRQVEDESGWPASCLCPHPWLDVPDFTVTLAGYADVDPEQISRGLAAAARALWAARRDLYRPMPDLAAAWDEAEASAQRPVILVDSGDVVLAGAPGDSTAILHFLQDRRTRLRCLLHVTCAEATAESRRWSLGESARCLIGTGQASGSSGTVEVCGRVACISDAPYVASGAYLGGMNVNAGRRVVIEWQTHTLVVAERPDPAHDPAFFRSLGIEPSRYDVIVVKSHNTFRPAYRSISERIIRAATPGATNPDLRALPYGPEMRRLYPLNQDAPASFGRE